MYQAIELRTSIRTYEKKPLSDNDILKVKNILLSVGEKLGPFNNKVRFFYVKNEKTTGHKIGTYGFIKNPPSFIGGVVKNTLTGMVDFGFLFEEIILRLTLENLGTVWLGGTYDRKDFDIHQEDDEIIAAISPVGYPSNQSIREKIIRGFAHANHRKPFSELFFENKDLTIIDTNHKYNKYFKVIQSAPSASNKQPWRVVLINDTFHFYLKRTKGYGNFLKLDIQAIDMGIAISHLYLTLIEDNYSPSFVNESPINLVESEYIISVKID